MQTFTEAFSLFSVLFCILAIFYKSKKEDTKELKKDKI